MFFNDDHARSDNRATLVQLAVEVEQGAQHHPRMLIIILIGRRGQGELVLLSRQAWNRATQEQVMARACEHGPVKLDPLKATFSMELVRLAIVSYEAQMSLSWDEREHDDAQAKPFWKQTELHVDGPGQMRRGEPVLHFLVVDSPALQPLHSDRLVPHPGQQTPEPALALLQVPPHQRMRYHSIHTLLHVQQEQLLLLLDGQSRPAQPVEPQDAQGLPERPGPVISSDSPRTGDENLLRPADGLEGPEHPVVWIVWLCKSLIQPVCHVFPVIGPWYGLIENGSLYNGFF